MQIDKSDWWISMVRNKANQSFILQFFIKKTRNSNKTIIFYILMRKIILWNVFIYYCIFLIKSSNICNMALENRIHSFLCGIQPVVQRQKNHGVKKRKNMYVLADKREKYYTRFCDCANKCHFDWISFYNKKKNCYECKMERKHIKWICCTV